MTRKEIIAQIRAKEKEIRHTTSLLLRSNDSEEIKNLDDTLNKLHDELDDLKTSLDEIEEDHGESRSFNYADTICSTENMRSIASYSMSSYGTAPSFTSQNDIALRSNETLLSRCKNVEKLDLGKYIRGIISGNWNDAAAEQRAMLTTSNGVLIPEVLSAQIIDLARNVSLFTRAGVPIYPMDSNNLTIAKVASDPVFSFKAEGEEQPNGNEFTLDDVELKAKTAYGYCYVSRENIMSAKNLTNILYQVFAQAMADCIDKAMLYGQDGVTYAPLGIMNDGNINTINAENDNYVDFVKAFGAIRRANGTPNTMAINAITEQQLALTVDSNNNPVARPEILNKLNTVVSNQLNFDEVEGSDALVFDSNAMIIGMQKNIVVRMFEDSDYCIKNNMVGFQIYAMLDCGIVRPTHITKITNLK